jgi:hypothetical protein
LTRTEPLPEADVCGSLWVHGGLPEVDDVAQVRYEIDLGALAIDPTSLDTLPRTGYVKDSSGKYGLVLGVQQQPDPSTITMVSDAPQLVATLIGNSRGFSGSWSWSCGFQPCPGSGSVVLTRPSAY